SLSTTGTTPGLIPPVSRRRCKLTLDFPRRSGRRNLSRPGSGILASERRSSFTPRLFSVALEFASTHNIVSPVPLPRGTASERAATECLPRRLALSVDTTHDRCLVE